MLDTNICIYTIRKRPPDVLTKFEKIQPSQLCISSVTFAELQYGIERSSSKRMNQEIVDQFSARLQILPWDEEAARQYGKIRRHLEKKGTPVGNMDQMIAAHARSQACVLVTNNLREFKRIPYLRLENWVGGR